MDVGPRRDLVGELANSIRARDIHFGLYFSQFAWFHPLYLNDIKDDTKLYPEVCAIGLSKTYYSIFQQISLPQMHELVERYKPEVLWSDGKQSLLLKIDF